MNQNLFVSFLFQAFPEAAKNVFCIRPYADFCFHVAGNNPPDLYQPFPRNSSNSFKKYKREKSSGKEQDGVSRCIFRKTSLNLKHEMNPNSTVYHLHLEEGFLRASSCSFTCQKCQEAHLKILPRFVVRRDSTRAFP